MKLFCELNEKVEYIVEERDGKKDMYIEGVFLQGAIKNRNGRIYPLDVLSNEVDRYISESVNKNRAYGELGHPQGPAINLDRVSHLVTSLVKEGNNWVGRAKVTNTPCGQIVKALIEDGANLGVSSRGLGTLKPVNGLMEVQGDFKLATAADIVADPSAPDAFVKGIMEGREYWYDVGRGTWVEEQLDNMQTELKQTSKADREKKGLIMFEKFINSLSQNTQQL